LLIAPNAHWSMAHDSEGDTGRFPRSSQKKSIDERGVQLYPCGIATVTPQIVTVASWPVATSRPEVPQPRTAESGTHRDQPNIRQI
jgi:hypothetical protein